MRGTVEKRQCFWESNLDEEGKLEVDFRDIGDGIKKEIKVKMSADEIYDKIFEVAGRPENKGISELKILQGQCFRKVCPISLIEYDYYTWVDIEQMCTQYKQLPFPGSIFEQPRKVIDILTSILEGKAMYQTDYYQDLKDKAGK